MDNNSGPKYSSNLRHRSPPRKGPSYSHDPHSQLSNRRPNLHEDYRAHDIDEEEEYDRRREEELKRQINLKESEIQNLSKASDYLRQRLDQSVVGTQRQNQNDTARYASFGRQLPERDKSPAISNRFPESELGGNLPPPYVREHMSNLQSDNASLMRRLNLVLQELDRVQREKDDIQQRLIIIAKDTTSLQKMINSDDNTDKMNKYMQDDLAYERDRNQKVKQRIKEEELYKNDMMRELNKLEDDQERQALDSQNLTGDLQKRINHIQDLEKEHYYTQEKLKQVNNSIELAKREELTDHSEKSDLQRIIGQLLLERNDLLSKLDNLTRKYDECVREISQDRGEMEYHNRQHSKLVTSKIIFQQLEMIQKSRIRNALEEVKIYCQFDRKCHNKLQAFARALNTVGRFKMQEGMRGWFSRGLKPLECKAQSEQLAAVIDATTIKGKHFLRWRQRYQDRIQAYDKKTQAVNLIWQSQLTDSNIEIKRAFDIWKQSLQTFHRKQMTIKRLIYSQYCNQLGLAFNCWQHHNANLDHQVRLNLLSKQFTHKQYLHVMFNGLREAAQEIKRKRMNILFHRLKDWKDFINHRKFLMGANVNASHYQLENDVSLLKACFDAFKQNKETEKFLKVDYELNQVERPLIEQLQNSHSNTESKNLDKTKRQMCANLSHYSSKAIALYFNHWKQINTEYKLVPSTKIKDRIIKVCHDTLRKAFNQWNVNSKQTKMFTQQLVISDIQEDSKEVQSNVEALQKEIKDKSENRDQSQKKNVNKCVKSFQMRLLKLGLEKWKANVNERNVKEDGAETIIKKMRNRFQRQGFDLYVSGIKYKKKIEIEEQRCLYFNKTREDRIKRNIYNAWHQFRGRFLKAKQYWNRIYIRLDLCQKSRALKIWQENSRIHAVEELQQVQSDMVDSVGQLNQEVGRVTGMQEGQTQEIKGMNEGLKRQAQRVLANRFANYYYVGQTRGFEKWKELVKFEKHKEALLRKMITHWRKFSFMYVTNCFKKWMMDQDIQERKGQVKKEEAKIKDVAASMEVQSKMFSSLQTKFSSELQQVSAQSSKYNHHLQQCIKIIVSKVDSNHFMSTKKYILQQWREYVRREKYFITHIEKVIQKSLWKNGFAAIRQAARDHTKDEEFTTVLTKFRNKFWKCLAGNAFSVWRSGNFKVVFTAIQETQNEIGQKVEEAAARTTVIKENNAAKSGKAIVSQSLRNVFQGWRNVTSHIKLQSNTKKTFITNTHALQIKYAMANWRGRKEATKSARLRSMRLKNKRDRMRTINVFQAMKDYYYATKDFMNRISNLASIHDHQAIKMGYNAIISFSKAKEYVFQKKKEHSTKEISSFLNNLLLRKMNQYMNELRFKTQSKYKEDVYKMYTVLHNVGNKMRVFFRRWKEHSNNKALEQELHDEGPVREQVFDYKMQLQNCKSLMKSEGYDDADIQKVMKSGKQQQSGLILKAVRRLQHFNQELYTKPKMFDKWREFVYMRRLYRYWLQYIANRGQFVKCDTAIAFNRWKKFDSGQKEVLSKMSKEQLDNRMIKNSQKLGGLADQIQEQEGTLNHLCDQRDELVENYIKGQKLALSLWNNNLKRLKHKALMIWIKNVGMSKSENLDDRLNRNIQLIAALKEKVRQFEHNNDDLSSENEELRQFSLDGYEIAKNVQQLTVEREKLSVDLADKAQIIRKLLDENEKLNKHLQLAQDEAQNLIKSTSKKFMAGDMRKGGSGGGIGRVGSGERPCNICHL